MAVVDSVQSLDFNHQTVIHDEIWYVISYQAVLIYRIMHFIQFLGFKCDSLIRQVDLQISLIGVFPESWPKFSMYRHRTANYLK